MTQFARLCTALCEQINRKSRLAALKQLSEKSIYKGVEITAWSQYILMEFKTFENTSIYAATTQGLSLFRDSEEKTVKVDPDLDLGVFATGPHTFVFILGPSNKMHSYERADYRHNQELLFKVVNMADRSPVIWGQ
jgi:hypothetical protein